MVLHAGDFNISVLRVLVGRELDFFVHLFQPHVVSQVGSTLVVRDLLEGRPVVAGWVNRIIRLHLLLYCIGGDINGYKF